MATNAIVAGVLLIVVGVVVTVVSDSSSATSLIPAFVGLILAVLGFAGRAKPDLNRHFMHAAAAVALLALLGSLGSLIGRGSTGWALVAQVATIVITGGFVILAVRSFIAARKAREAEAS